MIAATLMVKISADTQAFNTSLQRAQQAVRGSKAQMEQAATAVTALQTRMRTLSDAVKLGAMSEREWSAAVRTAIADAHQLAATSELTTKSQQRLANMISQGERQLRSAAVTQRRNVDGLEGMAVALNGVAMAATQGLSGVAAATSGFQQLAISMRAVAAVGVIGAIGAIVQVVMTLVGALKQSKQAANEAAQALEGMGTGRLRGLLQNNQALQALAKRSAAGENIGASNLRMIQEETGLTGITGFSVGLFRSHSSFMQIAAAKLNEVESTLRGALSVAESRQTVERGITRELARQADLVDQMLGAQRVVAGQRDSLLGEMMGRHAVRPVPVDDVLQGQIDFARKLQGAGSDAGLKDLMRGLKDDTVNLSGMIVSAVTNMASSLGEQLARGANFFKAFAASAVASLGAIIIGFGQMLIAQGTAGILKALPFFGGPLAIAAGAGLVALGSAMGGRGASRSGGGGGAGGGGGGFTGSAGTAERAQQVTVIQIVAQTTGQVIREYRTENARYAARGGAVPGTSTLLIPVEEAHLVTSRGFR